MFLLFGIFWLMVSLMSFFEWYHFCHSMSGTNHTKITMHRCIWQPLSYLNNYISFRNIYNTNRLFNKKNEYPYKINCLTSCKNVYFHFILYSLPMRFCIESIRRMLSEAVARHPNYKQSPTNHTFIKNMSYAHLSDDSNVAIILSYVLKWLISCW